MMNTYENTRWYCNVPAAPKPLQETVLENCVKFIGSQQPGKGSNKAKGRRYIKSKIPAYISTRQIKRTTQVKNGYANPNLPQEGAERYYFHKENCDKIVKTILEYVIEHADPQQIQTLFGCIPNDHSDFFTLSYKSRMDQLYFGSQTHPKITDIYTNVLTKLKKVKEEL